MRARSPAGSTPSRMTPYLGISLWTLREIIWRGELPHAHIGRHVLVDLADLDRYIVSHKATHR